MKKALTTNPNPAAAPRPKQPEGHGPTNPRILKTTDIGADGKPKKISDAAYIRQNAGPEDLADLRARLEAKEAMLEGQPDVILICQNPKCRAWGAYAAKDVDRALAGNASCIFCNYRNLATGGRMRKATAAETAQFWADKKRRDEIFRVRVKQQAKIEAERSRLGIDRVSVPPIGQDTTIKGFKP